MFRQFNGLIWSIFSWIATVTLKSLPPGWRGAAWLIPCSNSYLAGYQRADGHVNRWHRAPHGIYPTLSAADGCSNRLRIFSHFQVLLDPGCASKTRVCCDVSAAWWEARRLCLYVDWWLVIVEPEDVDVGCNAASKKQKAVSSGRRFQIKRGRED